MIATPITANQFDPVERFGRVTRDDTPPTPAERLAEFRIRWTLSGLPVPRSALRFPHEGAKAPMNTEATIRMDVVESKQIHSIGYYPATRTLAIRFKSWKGEPAALYYYENVTAEDYAALAAAESKGGHFNTHIKAYPQKYPYLKIESRPQDLAA